MFYLDFLSYPSALTCCAIDIHGVFSKLSLLAIWFSDYSYLTFCPSPPTPQTVTITIIITKTIRRISAIMRPNPSIIGTLRSFWSKVAMRKKISKSYLKTHWSKRATSKNFPTEAFRQKKTPSFFIFFKNKEYLIIRNLGFYFIGGGVLGFWG